MFEEIQPMKSITARKPHQCEWCGERIEKGDQCIRRVYRYDNSFNDARQHPECLEAMQSGEWMRNRLDCEFEPGEFVRGTSKCK